LDRIFGECRIAQDSQGEPVRGAAVAVVELGQSLFVRAADEGEQRLVGEVGEVGASSLLPAHARDGFYVGVLHSEAQHYAVDWLVNRSAVGRVFDPPDGSSETATRAPLGTGRVRARITR
jgi:hypothetical protein